MLSNEEVKEGYQGDGSRTTFPITFDYDETSEVLVLQRDEADADDIVETELTEGSEYSVDAYNQVVFGSAPSSTKEIWIIRRTPLTQPLQLSVSSNLNFTRIESYLDRMVRQAQELGEKVGRALKFRRSSPTDDEIFIEEPEASQLIAWNADADGIEPAGLTVAEFEEGVDDAVAASTSATSSANAASASATAAANSATAAANSATAAAASALAAAASETAAETAATAAAASETAAELAETNAETAETAAELAETNAETAEVAAEAAQAAAETAKTAAELAETNAETAETAAELAETNAETAEAAAEAAQAAAETARDEAEAAAAGAVPDIQGTRAAPVAVVAGDGIQFASSKYINYHFLQGSGGAVAISANPQIEVGSVVGQRLILQGRSDTNTVKLEDGTGVRLKGGAGELFLYEDTIAEFMWDGTNWVQAE